jgi:hypothetical protein
MSCRSDGTVATGSRTTTQGRRLNAATQRLKNGSSATARKPLPWSRQPWVILANVVRFWLICIKNNTFVSCTCEAKDERIWCNSSPCASSVLLSDLKNKLLIGLSSQGRSIMPERQRRRRSVSDKVASFLPPTASVLAEQTCVITCYESRARDKRELQMIRLSINCCVQDKYIQGLIAQKVSCLPRMCPEGPNGLPS